MKKIEFDLRLCLEVPPPEGDGDEGGGTGSSGSGDDLGAGDDEGGGAVGDSILIPKPIDPDPLWPPVGF